MVAKFSARHGWAEGAPNAGILVSQLAGAVPEPALDSSHVVVVFLCHSCFAEKVLRQSGTAGVFFKYRKDSPQAPIPLSFFGFPSRCLWMRLWPLQRIRVSWERRRKDNPRHSPFASRIPQPWRPLLVRRNSTMFLPWEGLKSLAFPLPQACMDYGTFSSRANGSLKPFSFLTRSRPSSCLKTVVLTIHASFALGLSQDKSDSRLSTQWPVELPDRPAAALLPLR